jgi:hypothetical protein
MDAPWRSFRELLIEEAKAVMASYIRLPAMSFQPCVFMRRRSPDLSLALT